MVQSPGARARAPALSPAGARATRQRNPRKTWRIPLFPLAYPGEHISMVSYVSRREWRTGPAPCPAPRTRRVHGDGRSSRQGLPAPPRAGGRDGNTRPGRDRRRRDGGEARGWTCAPTPERRGALNPSRNQPRSCTRDHAGDRPRRRDAPARPRQRRGQAPAAILANFGVPCFVLRERIIVEANRVDGGPADRGPPGPGRKRCRRTRLPHGRSGRTGRNLRKR